MVIIYKYTHINQKDTHYQSETHNKGHHWFICMGINLGIPTNIMKFEANIPSYLRTGQGVFPVKAKGTPKVEKETNFFKLMEKGVNMPVSNEVKGAESVLLGSAGMNESLGTGNFLDKMQDKIAAVPADQKLGPKKFPIDPNATPVMPQVPEKEITPPTMMEAEAEDADIFIG